MAKVEGTQSISSPILNKYKELLTRKTTTNNVRIRMPFQLPKAKAGGQHESAARAAQRARFSTAKDRFNTLGTDDRTNWYDSSPIWNSYLWYYNWFMLSALMGVTGIPGSFEAVIKSIQYANCQIGSAGGTGTCAYTSVNVDKVVFMINGAGWYDIGAGVAVAAYPYLLTHNATAAQFKGALDSGSSFNMSTVIIEYI